MSDHPLDAIFDRFISSPSIFKNHEVLRPSHIPERLPHRDYEIQFLGKALGNALRNDRPSNIFLYGKTGTGKTIVSKFVTKYLRQRAASIGKDIIVSILNCVEVDTDYRVLARLCEIVGETVPFTGLPTDEVFKRFKNKLDSKKQLLIVVFDELDKLHNKSGDNVLYQLTRINTDLKRAQVSLVCITNDLSFKETLDPRVRSSLSEEELVFKPYNATQLEDILSDRAQEGFNDNVLTNGVISLCAALAAQEHGDARRALDLLRVAAELAERGSEEVVDETHVRKATKQIEKNTVQEVLVSLPVQTKVVLWSVYTLEKSNLKIVTTGDLYKVYLELCKITSLDPITPRRANSLLNELSMLGVVNTKVVSMGRYGRTTKVSLSVSPREVRNILCEDFHIKKVSDFDAAYLIESN
ncbi:MAG TPA: ORC1-type DNA replication protein [candidate division Zixibacteria bacterium]|nr:ORC1-type DNA replication protein [candidate division Zixibacteria bacterium]